MPVPPPLRRPFRAAALALVLMMLTPAFVLQGAAQLPGETSWILKLKQGDARILNANEKQVWFLDNGTTAKVQVVVENHGSGDVNDVPVYFWFSNATADPTLSTLPVYCLSADVPGRQFNSTTNGWDPGKSIPLNWTFAVPVNVPPGGHNITIRVNQAPAPAPAMSRFAAYNCPPEKHGQFAAGNPDLAVDPASPDHTIQAYFVKDLRPDFQLNATAESSGIRWCRTAVDGTPCDEDMSLDDHPFWYNRTVHAKRPTAAGASTFENNSDEGPTYLQIGVKNVGNLTDLVDYGSACKCAGFPYRVGVTANGFGLPRNANVSWSGAAPNTTKEWITVGYLPLREKAGTYQVNVTLDPPESGFARGRIPEMAPEGDANNAGTRRVDIKWVDYAASINATDFRTDPFHPYEYTTEFEIAGNVEFRNLGDGPIMHPEKAAGSNAVQARVPYRIHMPGTNFSVEGDFEPALGVDADGDYFRYANVYFSFNASNVPGNTPYVRPGKHTIVAEIDEGNLSFEPNETNDRATLDIYVNDTRAPSVVQALYITEYGLSGQEKAITATKPRKAFTLHAAIDDDDRQSLTAVARFTLDGDASKQRNYTLELSTPAGIDFYAAVSNFTMATNGSSENWTYVMDVTDAFGNKAPATPAKKLRLDRYAIQTQPAADVVMQYEDGKSFNYSDDDTIVYYVRVNEEWTGVPDQAVETKNLFMWVKPAGANEINISDGWKNLTECTQEIVPPSKVGELPRETRVCNAATPEYYSTFQNIVSRASGKPGLWNVSIGVMDVSGEMRYLNRTLFLADLPPVPVAADALQRVSGVWRPTRSAGNNDTIWITANFSDDQASPMTAFANFSRSDGKWANFTLEPRASSVVRNETTGALVPHYEFNSSLTVGQARALGLGGDLNLTIVGRDSTGNWASAPVIPFKVNDTQVPALFDARVTPAIQEVGQDVVFRVRASDETNVTAVVSVQNGDVDVLPPTPMLTTDGRNFTYAANLTVEGNYAWTIAVRDSLGQSSQETGTLAIRDNLGPRYEIRSPSNVVAGARFGPALPRIEVVAFDSDNVDPTSVVFVVDGQPVVPEMGPAPAGVNGVTLSHQVPASRRFFHGDEVAVNVTAVDGSSKHLPGYLNFTFRVDDVAPTTRLASFTPQFRDAPSQDWNVSLETLFRLEADDNDGLPTDVAAIHYRILVAGGNSGENLYTGPFRIRDVAGVYRGPTNYNIQYWAEDSAGNVNSTRLSTRVYVDDAPPELVQYFPQGYYVNATFVDDRVGVARAVVWHRVNAEPYKPLSLEPAGNNLWQGVIPEARKGDRVSYYLQAWDQLDNAQTFGNASDPKVSFPATNHNPAIRVTSPVTGGVVSGTFNLEWTASDEDGDALTFLVAVKSPGKTGYTDLAKLDTPDTRRYPVDSRRFLDGEHVFRVSANDGGVVRHSEVTLRILNRADPIVSVSPVTGEVTPGSTVLLKAEIAKAEAVVEARLYRDGEFVGAYAMNDEGREGDEVANDGIYSVRAPVEESGDYSVEIVTRYQEDGVTKSSNRMDAVTFSSRMTPGYVLREYAVVLVLIAVAAAVAIGLAAWALMRKRR